VRKANPGLIHDRFETDLEKVKERLLHFEALIKLYAAWVKTEAEEPVEGLEPLRDLSWLFEAACLAVFARWESFCMEVFRTSLNRDSSRLRQRLGLRTPKHLTAEACEALLTWGRDFPSAPDRVRDFAKEVLAVNPFGKLTRKQREVLAELYAIRNRVAHPRSHRAIERYRAVVGTTRNPGPFLRARPSGGAAPRLPRLLGVIDSLIAASRSMRTGWST